MKNKINKELSVKIKLKKGKLISELRFPDLDLIISFNPPYSGSIEWKKSWKPSLKNVDNAIRKMRKLLDADESNEKN